MSNDPPNMDSNFHRPGSTRAFSGFVTQICHLVNKPAHALEAILGFGKGRLSGGWALYELRDDLRASEFRYAGTTRESGGVSDDSSTDEQLREAGFLNRREKMPVPAAALLRHAMSRQTESDGVYDVEMENEFLKICERKGLNRIAKCVALIAGAEYPPAKIYGIPQWELLCKKNFYCCAVIAPGRTHFEKTLSAE
jgi:hypothetical protein